MRKLVVCLLVLVSPVLHAQTRNDTTVYVAPTVGGNTTEQIFFNDNMKSEVRGANYLVVDSKQEADYTVNLSITREEDYDDPTVMVSVLNLSLIRNEDSYEVVQFSWEYYEVEEMYNWNLYLVYQAMANVPMTKVFDAPHTDHWRNKWLYVSPQVNYTFHAYYFEGSTGLSWDFNAATPIGGAVDVELHFLNWMSVETGMELSFETFPKSAIYKQTDKAKTEPGDFSATTVLFPLLIKFVWKPYLHFMVEPYAGVGLNMGINRDNLIIPFLSVLGGAQWAVKLGERGGIYLDTRFGWDLGNGQIPGNIDVTFHRYTITVGLGYKIGFFNRYTNEELP
jgi:hypothetical protein